MIALLFGFHILPIADYIYFYEAVTRSVLFIRKVGGGYSDGIKRGVVHYVGFSDFSDFLFLFFLDFLVLYNFENSENFTIMPNVFK